MKQLKPIVYSLLLWLTLSIANAQAILTASDGTEIAFSSLKGKWVVINFWASWCQPCLNEIHQFNTFYDQYKGKVAVFAVNFDSPSSADLQQLSKRLNIRYPSLLKNPSQQLQLGHIRGVPMTFVFNPNGQLSDTLYGPQTVSSLIEAIHGKG